MDADGADPRSGNDTFLHLTDLHFWQVLFNPLQLASKRFLGNLNVALRRRKEFLTSQAQSFVEYIASLNIPDVIVTGDFSSTATDVEFSEARRFVEALVGAGLRPVVIPGNHDVYTFESARKDRFENYLGDWLPAPTLPASGTLPGGTPVVYVPTVCPNLLSSRGRITTREVDETREHLKALETPVVIAAHYPLLDHTYGYTTTAHRRLEGAAHLRDALSTYSHRMLYIAGHVHRFSHVNDPIFPNISYLTTGALFRRDHDGLHTGEFSEIRVGRGGFRVLRHRYSQSWTVTEEPPRTAEVTDAPSA